MHVEEISKAELARLRSGRSRLSFCPRPSNPVTCEGKVSGNLLRSIILRLARFDWPQLLRIDERMVVRVDLP